jgi:hypothetical protein
MRQDRVVGGSGSIHSKIVEPIWDADTRAWVLKGTGVTNSFKVHPGVYPLRMRPPVDRPEAKFNAFVDAVFDPLLESTGAIKISRREKIRVSDLDLPDLVTDSDGDSDNDTDNASGSDAESREVKEVLN